MKFKTVLSLLTTAGFAFAAENAPQQGSIITQAVRQIERTLSQYDKAVREFSGSITNVLDRQYKLTTTFRTNIDKINTSTNLTIAEVVDIQTATGTLQGTVDSLNNDLNSKKAAFSAIGQAPTIRFALQSYVENVEALAKAISLKAPADVAPLVFGFVAGSVRSFRRASESFENDDISWKVGSAKDQIRNSVSVVQGAIVDLDRTVQATNSKSRALFDAANTLSGAFSVSTERIYSATSVDITASGDVQVQVQGIQSALDSLVKNLIQRKAQLVATGHGDVIAFALKSYLFDAKLLTTATGAKFPTELQVYAAKNMYLAMEKSLRNGLASFETESGIF
jgi:hypothetical protein